MRAYLIGNMYLSSIQQGIQAAHCIAEMFTKYTGELLATRSQGPTAIQLFDWAQNHKTVIVLNGGYSSALETLYQLFDSDENPYAYAKFHEEEAALNGALTSVGIIVPSRIYEAVRALNSSQSARERWEVDQVIDTEVGDEFVRYDSYTRFECKLIEALRPLRLAQ